MDADTTKTEEAKKREPILLINPKIPVVPIGYEVVDDFEEAAPGVYIPIARSGRKDHGGPIFVFVVAVMAVVAGLLIGAFVWTPPW